MGPCERPALHFALGAARHLPVGTLAKGTPRKASTATPDVVVRRTPRTRPSSVATTNRSPSASVSAGVAASGLRRRRRPPPDPLPSPPACSFQGILYDHFMIVLLRRCHGQLQFNSLSSVHQVTRRVRRCSQHVFIFFKAMSIKIIQVS